MPRKSAKAKKPAKAKAKPAKAKTKKAAVKANAKAAVKAKTKKPAKAKPAKSAKPAKAKASALESHPSYAQLVVALPPGRHAGGLILATPFGALDDDVAPALRALTFAWGLLPAA